MAFKTLFSVGPGVFTDEDFERAVNEIDKPDLEGWEFFIESMNTKIYRKYKEVGVSCCVCSLCIAQMKLVVIVGLQWQAKPAILARNVSTAPMPACFFAGIRSL